MLYFKARNGTYKRVPQRSNAGFEGTTGGGMTVYYMTDPLYDSRPKSKVTAFKPVSTGTRLCSRALQRLLLNEQRVRLGHAPQKSH